MGNGRGDGGAASGGFAVGGGGGGGVGGFFAARLAAGAAAGRGGFEAGGGGASICSTSTCSGIGSNNAPAPTKAANATMMYPQVRGTFAPDYQPPDLR